MKSYLCLITLLFVTLVSCKKDEPDFDALSGIWTVDSVEVANFEDDVEVLSVLSMESPSSMDFNVMQEVTWTTTGQSQTALFDQYQDEFALSDLDFDQTIDTVHVRCLEDNTILSWTSNELNLGSTSFKTVTTIIISKD